MQKSGCPLRSERNQSGLTPRSSGPSSAAWSGRPPGFALRPWTRQVDRCQFRSYEIEPPAKRPVPAVGGPFNDLLRSHTSGSANGRFSALLAHPEGRAYENYANALLRRICDLESGQVGSSEFCKRLKLTPELRTLRPIRDVTPVDPRSFKPARGMSPMDREPATRDTWDRV
jgi:hypothetical protein